MQAKPFRINNKNVCEHLEENVKKISEDLGDKINSNKYEIEDDDES
jgi:hypothetical protein